MKNRYIVNSYYTFSKMVGSDGLEPSMTEVGKFTVSCNSRYANYPFLLKFKPKHVPKNAPRQAGKINIWFDV